MQCEPAAAWHTDRHEFSFRTSLLSAFCSSMSCVMQPRPDPWCPLEKQTRQQMQQVRRTGQKEQKRQQGAQERGSGSRERRRAEAQAGKPPNQHGPIGCPCGVQSMMAAPLAPCRAGRRGGVRRGGPEKGPPPCNSLALEEKMMRCLPVASVDARSAGTRCSPFLPQPACTVLATMRHCQLH